MNSKTMRVIISGIGLIIIFSIIFAYIYFVSCSFKELIIFYQFPHYGDRFLFPSHRPGFPHCVANFGSPDPPEQIVQYYKQQLQEHDWEIIRDQGSVYDVPISEGPNRLTGDVMKYHGYGITALRDDLVYDVISGRFEDMPKGNVIIAVQGKVSRMTVENYVTIKSVSS